MTHLTSLTCRDKTRGAGRTLEETFVLLWGGGHQKRSLDGGRRMWDQDLRGPPRLRTPPGGLPVGSVTAFLLGGGEIRGFQHLFITHQREAKRQPMRF